MVDKKAQFKIQQMAFMLVGIVMFFLLVALFWFSLQSRSLTRQATQLEKDRAVLMSEFLSGSAEFSCGSYCVDTDRMLFLNAHREYEGLWPVSYIKVRKTSPKLEGEVECTPVNYPDDCNVFILSRSCSIPARCVRIGLTLIPLFLIQTARVYAA